MSSSSQALKCRIPTQITRRANPLRCAKAHPTKTLTSEKRESKGSVSFENRLTFHVVPSPTSCRLCLEEDLRGVLELTPTVSILSDCVHWHGRPDVLLSVWSLPQTLLCRKNFWATLKKLSLWKWCFARIVHTCSWAMWYLQRFYFETMSTSVAPRQ